jgi:TetR/AcrR family transcriptional regulator, repressor of fatR-cypB operon
MSRKYLHKDHNDKKVRIMEAGKRLFVKYGNNGFSMRDLAKNLEMSQGNIYNYFSSKRELWFAIQQKERSQLYQEFEVILKENNLSSQKQVFKIVTKYLNIARTNYPRVNIMFQDTPPESNKPPGDCEKNYKIRSPLLLVRDFIRRAIQKGDWQKEDADKITYFYWAIIYGISEISQMITEMDLHFDTKISIEEFHKYGLDKLTELLN